MKKTSNATNQKIPNALDIAQKLIRIPSITPHDGGILDDLQSLLSGAGFTCHRLLFSDQNTPNVDNLYARFGTEAPHLCFAGHVDVVPPGDVSRWTVPPFAGEVHDGKLYGRGAADMKGGIAAFVAAVYQYIAEQNGQFAGSISFLITGDEEGPAINGSVKMLQWLENRGELIDHCIVGEPTNMCTLGDMIKIGRRGSLSGILTVHGKQGHVAYPQLANNPVTGIVNMISTLLKTSLDSGNDNFQPSNLEFTSVDTNNPIGNVIPEMVRANFNIRFNDIWTSDKLKNQVSIILDKVAHEQNLRYTITYNDSHEAFLTPHGKFTELISLAVQQITGRQPALSTSGGTSDARFIRYYCPVVECGLISKSIHQIDEHVDVADLYALTGIYHTILNTYFAAREMSGSARDAE